MQIVFVYLFIQAYQQSYYKTQPEKALLREGLMIIFICHEWEMSTFY